MPDDSLTPSSGDMPSTPTGRMGMDAGPDEGTFGTAAAGRLLGTQKLQDSIDKFSKSVDTLVKVADKLGGDRGRVANRGPMGGTQQGQAGNFQTFPKQFNPFLNAAAAFNIGPYAPHNVAASPGVATLGGVGGSSSAAPAPLTPSPLPETTASGAPYAPWANGPGGPNVASEADPNHPQYGGSGLLLGGSGGSSTTTPAPMTQSGNAGSPVFSNAPFSRTVGGVAAGAIVGLGKWGASNLPDQLAIDSQLYGGALMSSGGSSTYGSQISNLYNTATPGNITGTATSAADRAQQLSVIQQSTGLTNPLKSGVGRNMLGMTAAASLANPGMSGTASAQFASGFYNPQFSQNLMMMGYPQASLPRVRGKDQTRSPAAFVQGMNQFMFQGQKSVDPSTMAQNWAPGGKINAYLTQAGMSQQDQSSFQGIDEFQNRLLRAGLNPNQATKLTSGAASGNKGDISQLEKYGIKQSDIQAIQNEQAQVTGRKAAENSGYSLGLKVAATTLGDWEKMLNGVLGKTGLMGPLGAAGGAAGGLQALTGGPGLAGLAGAGGTAMNFLMQKKMLASIKAMQAGGAGEAAAGGAGAIGAGAAGAGEGAAGAGAAAGAGMGVAATAGLAVGGTAATMAVHKGLAETNRGRLPGTNGKMGWGDLITGMGLPGLATWGASALRNDKSAPQWLRHVGGYTADATSQVGKGLNRALTLGNTIGKDAMHLVGLASGGLVKGQAGPDKVKAMLTKDEYVLNKGATSAMGETALDALNTKYKTAGAKTGMRDGTFYAAAGGSPKGKKKAPAKGGSGEAIAKYAKDHLHIGVYGGDNWPHNFDCSAFTSHVYEQFGYKDIPRTSEAQQNWAKGSGDVPGALVFMVGEGYPDPGHVGISVGGGKMVDSGGGDHVPNLDTIGGLTHHGSKKFGVPPKGFGTGDPGGGAGGGAGNNSSAGSSSSGGGGGGGTGLVFGDADLVGLGSGGDAGGGGNTTAPSSPTGGGVGGGNGNAASGSGYGTGGKAIYNYLLKNLFSGHKIAAAGATASIYGESHWDPESVEPSTQYPNKGDGNGGLIGWTYAGGGMAHYGIKQTGNRTKDMAQQLPKIIDFVKQSGDMGVIAQMNKAKTILDAANLWGKGVERYGINDVTPAGLAGAKKIAGLAGGGHLAPGTFAVVGERGKEIIHTSKDAEVYSAAQSAKLKASVQMPDPVKSSLSYSNLSPMFQAGGQGKSAGASTNNYTFSGDINIKAAGGGSGNNPTDTGASGRALVNSFIDELQDINLHEAIKIGHKQ